MNRYASDPDEYHRRWEREHLAKRICPWSGEKLTRDGDGVPGSMSCVLCDCFGYDPKVVGRG